MSTPLPTADDRPAEPATGTADLASPPADELVTISRAELDRLRATASTPDSTRARDEESRNRDAAHAEELAARDRRSAAVEASYRGAVRDRELATALAGRPLVAGAAAQLVKLWSDELDVHDDAGTLKVSARDGRTVDRWVADRLAGTEYAHFCLPSSRGGAGPKGLSQSGGDAGTASPRTLGEAIVTRWREAARSAAPATPAPAGWGPRR